MSRSSDVSADSGGDNIVQNALYETYKKVKEYLYGLPVPFGEKLSEHACHAAHEDLPSGQVKPASEEPVSLVVGVFPSSLSSTIAAHAKMLSHAPDNLGIVVPDAVYRSSYPKPENYPYLKTLGLKTILTLVPEPIAPEYQQFMDGNGIQHFQVHIPANKGRVQINACEMTRALDVVLDKRNHPMLIHCNKGKHRTGCVVGCFRRVQGQESEAVFDEYHKYAREKARLLDEAFIEQFDENTVMWMARRYNWIEPIERQLPSPAPTVNGTSISATSSTCDLYQPEADPESVNGIQAIEIAVSDTPDTPEVPHVHDAVPKFDNINGKSPPAP